MTMITNHNLCVVWLLQESQYAKWMAACRLAAKGRSLADASYEAEVASIQSFLQMQHPSPMPAINPASLDILPEEYVAPRYFKKLKSKVKPFIQYIISFYKCQIPEQCSLPIC